MTEQSYSETSSMIEDVSFDDHDEIINPRPEETDFDRIVEQAISRRGFMGGVLAMGSVAVLGGTTALTPAEAAAASGRFGFEGIPASTLIPSSPTPVRNK